MVGKDSIVDELLENKHVLGLGLEGDKIILYVEKGFKSKILNLIYDKRERIKIIEVEKKFEVI